jgi:hypothetical protein
MAEEDIDHFIFEKYLEYHPPVISQMTSFVSAGQLQALL